VYDITARRRAEGAVRRLAQLQTVVAGLGEYALRGATLDKVMGEAVVQVSRALGTEFCKVLELLPGGQSCLLKWGIGWKPGYVGSSTVWVGERSQAGSRLLSTEPVVVADFRIEKRFLPSELLLDHGVIGGVSVVIRTKKGPTACSVRIRATTETSQETKSAFFRQFPTFWAPQLNAIAQGRSC